MAAAARGGATEAVRQELARVPVEDDEAARAELGALLRAAGTLRRSRDAVVLELATRTGATARRAHRLLQRLDAEPTVWVRDATNVEQRTYGVALDPASTTALGRRLGLLDEHARPLAVAPDEHLARPSAVLRGALLGAGTVSDPRRPAHLELVATQHATAVQLADLVATVVGTRPSVGTTRSGYRAVLKSHTACAELLGAVGATAAYLARGEQRLRRDVRGQAQRLANADAANVARAVRAASAQTGAVQAAVAVLGWDGLPDDLREVALARLANPAAALAELGALCDPPIGKSAVHRRLARLTALAASAEAAGDARRRAGDAPPERP